MRSSYRGCRRTPCTTCNDFALCGRSHDQVTSKDAHHDYKGEGILFGRSIRKITSDDNTIVKLVMDEKVGRDVGEIVDRDGLEPVLIVRVVAHKFPTICKNNPMYSTMQAEPRVSRVPQLFQPKIMLSSLVVVVNLWGHLEILRDDRWPRDRPSHEVTMVVGPTLNVGIAVLN
jgi:hypothetical protein